MNKAYYVFRISDDEDENTYLLNEISNGRLRQGWSVGLNFDLNKHNLESLKEEHFKVWNEKLSNRKANCFLSMKEFKLGDLLIVPKNPKFRHFYILEVIGDYYYDYEKRDGNDDFRHVIPVKIIKSAYYNSDNCTRIISNKFRAYQSPVNRVMDKAFIDSIEEIIASDLEYNKDVSNFEALDVWNDEKFESLAEHLLEQINNWSPRKLEEIIKVLFEENGFECIGNNIYDKKGGDIDLLFNFPKNQLWNDLISLDITDVEYNRPKLAVQVKNKRGNDVNIKEGIDQLIKMKDKDNIKASYNILLNTTREVDIESKEYAKENDILVVHGKEFAKILTKYGLGITEFEN